MDLIKLLDIANPKTIKDTINAMIGITGTANTNASNAVTTANEAKTLSQTAVTNSTSAKQTAEEALAIIEEADTRSEEASLLAEQAIADADDAVDTAELALNTANAARSAVDQALDLGQIGSFVHNTSGIALIHAYMTDNVNQTDDTTLDRYYVATPKLVRDVLASYMNKVNPTATGSFSLNRSANSVVGDKSSTFGNGNVASGSASHAEGYATEATGNSSHAEGSATQATGNNSHAEGFFTEANDECSHAEGYDSVANGAFSHAEGGSTANGYYSHAEGLETVATHRSQHVFGELNIEDSNGASADNRGDYVEIVGNGQVVNNQLIRRNARTLDWEGNEWLAGNLTFATGKTTKVPTPTANEDAVPKSYVDNNLDNKVDKNSLYAHYINGYGSSGSVCFTTFDNNPTITINNATDLYNYLSPWQNVYLPCSGSVYISSQFSANPVCSIRRAKGSIYFRGKATDGTYNTSDMPYDINSLGAIFATISVYNQKLI